MTYIQYVLLVHPIIKDSFNDGQNGYNGNPKIKCRSVVPHGTIIIDNYCNVYVFKEKGDDSIIELEKVKSFSILSKDEMNKRMGIDNNRVYPYSIRYEKKSEVNVAHPDAELFKYQKFEDYKSLVLYNSDILNNRLAGKKLDNPLCNDISRSIEYKENIYCAPPNIIDLIKDTFTGLNVDNIYNFYKMIKNFHYLILNFVNLEKQQTLNENLQTELNKKLLNEKLLNEKLLNEKLLNDKLQVEKLQVEKLQNKLNEMLLNEKLQVEKLQVENLQNKLNEKLLNEKLQNEKLQNEKLQSEKLQNEIFTVGSEKKSTPIIKSPINHPTSQNEIFFVGSEKISTPIIKSPINQPTLKLIDDNEQFLILMDDNKKDEPFFILLDDNLNPVTQPIVHKSQIKYPVSK